MFVQINNLEMNICDIDGWIKNTRTSDGGIISPKHAMEILAKTNHLAHIKKILKNIKEKCQTTKQIAPYKEFILSCVDGREMSEIALDELRQLATKCGCIEELEQLNKKEKIYNHHDCENMCTAKHGEALGKLLDGTHKNLDVIYTFKGIRILDGDFSNIKKIRFLQPSFIDIHNGQNTPEIMDLRNCNAIHFFDIDFAKTKEIYFGPTDETYIINGINFPEILDFSQTPKLYLSGSDFTGVKELKFAQESTVMLKSAKNLPETLDLSMCKVVQDILYCDLSTVKEIKLKNPQQKKKFLGKKEFTGKITYTQLNPIEKLFGKKFE